MTRFSSLARTVTSSAFEAETSRRRPTRDPGADLHDESDAAREEIDQV